MEVDRGDGDFVLVRHGLVGLSGHPLGKGTATVLGMATPAL
jgi:hypothetical protein